MANKQQLRSLRLGTIINATARQQESDVYKALGKVIDSATREFPSLRFIHRKDWLLRDIVAELRRTITDTEFHCHFETSAIRPDGGILQLQGQGNDPAPYPILIAEVKNQGTNDARSREGLAKQARGNAIERLGKNLIGFRTALIRESIFPFVCFGYGCDFDINSSILDRVSTMAMFGRLNQIHLHNDAEGRLARGSFYFREQRWSVDEMAEVMWDIAKRSVLYYLSKYREEHFRS